LWIDEGSRIVPIFCFSPASAAGTPPMTVEPSAQFEHMVAVMPDAVVVTDQQGIVQFANPAALELFDKTAAEFVGTAAGFSARQGEACEIEVLRGDGRRDAEAHVAECNWNGRPALLAVIRDITDRKQLSEHRRQAQKMEAVSLLAGGIAHDFNNLLLVMLIYAEMVRADCAQDDPRLSDITEVVRAVERAQALTRQLLAFSRKHPAHPTVIDLNDVVAGVQPALRTALPANIEIATRFADQPWPILADRRQIEAVITNLASNAMDAMPDGGRFVLEIQNRSASRASQSAMRGDRVALCASDNGVGIAPAHIDRIFEPFFTTKRRGQGAGLGLATCYGIVAQAGGSIAVESEQGKGTTFTILLPRARGEGAEKPAEIREASAHQGHETIMVVEDDVAVMRATSSILRSHGYHVVTAMNGDEAFRLLQGDSDKINLVLSDVVMPQLSGPALEKIIAENWPRLPLIFMTGYSEQPVSHEEDGIRLENRPVLMKPFRANALLRIVRDTLDKAG
jgi:two-component system, cell cycle sensor histidine kinase and response regulator CckA